MRAKFKFLIVAPLLMLGLTQGAQSAIIINPPPPGPQSSSTATSFTLYYAGGASPTPSPGYIDSLQGFRYIWTADTQVATDPQNWLLVDVSSTNTYSVSGSQVVGISLYAGGTVALGSEIPILGAGSRNGTSAPAVCDGTTNCEPADSDGKYYTAYYTSGGVTRIGFSLAGLCGVSAAASLPICVAATGYQSLNQNMVTASLAVSMGVVPTGTPKMPVPAPSPSETQPFSINVSDIAPSVTCPGITEAQFYFPGDKQIYLNSANLTQSTATAAGTPGPPMQSIIYTGQIGSDPSVPPTGVTTTAGSVIGYGDPANTSTITGFTNSTNGTNNGYTSVVYGENSAGMISDFTTGSCSPAFLVRSQTIQGLLKESRCFIATAAYHSGTVGPVILLRKFRDQILSRFSWGRKFISKYYQVSPALAEWAWDKPIVRSFALKLLTPLEIAAWVTLKISGAVESTTSVEPYLDRVRKQMHEEPSGQPSTSYSEEEKKKLEAEPKTYWNTPTPNYADQEREKLLKKDPPDSAQDYADKAQKSLPHERYKESPTELVKSGKDLKLGFVDVPPIKNAVSFRMGISPGMQVTANGSTNSFSDIYGSSWQPELFFHFERQLFHSENFGSVGLTAETGLTYAEGYGRLSFAFPTGSSSFVSQTKFSFLQVPGILGVNYRFNLLRIVRPYVGAGTGLMVYDEVRHDNNPDIHGYSFIYNASAGISLLMDGIDRDAAHEAYLSEGIQHMYWFAEYFYLNTFASPVIFSRSGIYSGFMFEL